MNEYKHYLKNLLKTKQSSLISVKQKKHTISEIEYFYKESYEYITGKKLSDKTRPLKNIITKSFRKDYFILLMSFFNYTEEEVNRELKKLNIKQLSDSVEDLVYRFIITHQIHYPVMLYVIKDVLVQFAVSSNTIESFIENLDENYNKRFMKEILESFNIYLSKDIGFSRVSLNEKNEFFKKIVVSVLEEYNDGYENSIYSIAKTNIQGDTFSTQRDNIVKALIYNKPKTLDALRKKTISLLLLLNFDAFQINDVLQALGLEKLDKDNEFDKDVMIILATTARFNPYLFMCSDNYQEPNKSNISNKFEYDVFNAFSIADVISSYNKNIKKTSLLS